MSPGLFVTLEGPDGSGKSTLAATLKDRLDAEGYEVICTREPGGSPGAEQIRRLLVEGDSDRWSPETEILLFTAARRDHVERVIEPAIEAGKIVIADRYVDSTRAYQGVGDPARARLVDWLHEHLIGREADLTLILDLPPADGLGRTATRDGEEARYEARGFPFQERLRTAYAQIARAAPERYVTLDASLPAETVAANAWAALASRLPPRPADG